MAIALRPNGLNTLGTRRPGCVWVALSGLGSALDDLYIYLMSVPFSFGLWLLFFAVVGLGNEVRLYVLGVLVSLVACILVV